MIWPGDLAEHLIDLTPYLTEEEIAAHFPAIIENNTVDGQLLGIPWFTDAGLPSTAPICSRSTATTPRLRPGKS